MMTEANLFGFSISLTVPPSELFIYCIKNYSGKNAKICIEMSVTNLFTAHACNMVKNIEIQPGFEPGSSEFRSDALTN